MEIEDIKRIEFRPGDKLVLRVDHHLSLEQAQRIKRDIEAFAPGAPAIVLGKGMTLDVLSEAAA